LIIYKNNVRANIPGPQIMKSNPRTLKKAARNLVVPKIAEECKLYQQEECKLYQQEESVNNCNKSPSNWH
jgi:hypothetical protein